MDLQIVLITALVILDPVPIVGHECTGSHTAIIPATSEPQLLTSPGYPSNYPNSFSCHVVLNTTSLNHVILIETLHMELSDWGNSCGDRLKSYDGDSNKSKLLAKWCCRKQNDVMSGGSTMMLEFQSDDHTTATGFALRFSEQPKWSCNEGESDINVTSTAMYLPLQNWRNCHHRLAADEDNVVIISMNTAATASNSMCNDSELQINDGDFQILKCCYQHRPIVRLWASNRTINLITRMLNSEHNGSFAKVVTRSRKENCSSSKPVTVEVFESASYISFPIYLNQSGYPCPVRLISHDFKKTLRIDVKMVSHDGKVSCVPFDFGVQEGNATKTPLEGECVNNLTRFRSETPVVDIHINNDTLIQNNRLYVNVVARERQYNADGETRIVSNNTENIMTIINHIPPFGLCLYTFFADNKSNDVIDLEVKGHFHWAPGSQDVTHICQGPSIKFYDGKPSPAMSFLDTDGNERKRKLGLGHVAAIGGAEERRSEVRERLTRNRDGPVLKTWCPRREDTIRVRTKGTQLTLFIIGDNVETKSDFIVKYYALSERAQCGGKLVDLKASAKMVKYIMSPNHPGMYSLNNDCVWRLSAPRINYVVLLSVIWSDLPDDCSDLLYVIYGLYPTDPIADWICGRHRKSFRSTGAFLVLRFTSNSHRNTRGFKLSYSSEHKTGGKRTQKGPPIEIIAGACIAIFVVAGVIFVLVHINRKRHKEAKRKREECY